MDNSTIKRVLEEMNNSMSDILSGGVFVIDIKIDTIEYYYDKDINKIKTKIKTTQNKNDKIFKNQKLQNILDDFLQELANEMNEELTSDKELENLINALITDKVKD